MKKSLSIVAGLLLSFSAAQALAADHVVKMLNNGAEGTMMFEPGYLKVAPGDTVTFKSVDPAHNSVSVHIPQGAQAWTGEMSKDLTITLHKEGVYIYKCVPHTVMAMVGVIQVGGAGNKDAAMKAADDLGKQFAMNKDRLQKYMAKVQ